MERILTDIYVFLLARYLRDKKCPEGFCGCMPEYVPVLKPVDKSGESRSIITVPGTSLRSPAFRLAEIIGRHREAAVSKPVFICPDMSENRPFRVEDTLYVGGNVSIGTLAKTTADAFYEFICL